MYRGVGTHLQPQDRGPDDRWIIGTQVIKTAMMTPTQNPWNCTLSFGKDRRGCNPSAIIGLINS